MSIKVYVSRCEAIKNVEIAYEVIKKIEERFKKKLIYISDFTSNIAIEDFLNPLISKGFIDENFRTFVLNEYGEPWVKGFPIDSELLVEAIQKYTGKSKEEIVNVLSYIIATFCISHTSYKTDIYRIFQNGSINSVYIEPIDKKLRNFSFIGDGTTILAKDLKKEAYDSVLESTEVIMALTDDELIKEQVLNIKEKIFGKETLEEKEE